MRYKGLDYFIKKAAEIENQIEAESIQEERAIPCEKTNSRERAKKPEKTIHRERNLRRRK